MARWLLLLLTTIAVAAPAAAQSTRTYGIVDVQYGRARAVAREAYDSGYRDGARQGEFDARRGMATDFARDPLYRDGMRGYDRRLGSRDVYREDFRRGYIDGYRASYARALPPPPPAVYAAAPPAAIYQQPPVNIYQERTGPGVLGPGAYQEPAYARGYSDGFKQGLNDGRGRHAYNAIDHGDYRDGDNGYYRSYGPRDAYKNNYRSGYRTGYEEGYRNATGR